MQAKAKNVLYSIHLFEKNVVFRSPFYLFAQKNLAFQSFLYNKSSQIYSSLPNLTMPS